MQRSNLSFYCGLLLLLNAQLSRGHPLHGASVAQDVEMLKALLQRMEGTFSQAEEAEPLNTEPSEEELLQAGEERQQPETASDDSSLAELEEYLSARDLKAIRSSHSKSKRYSGCFGRRMDRIGSLSSLGCNTASRYNSKRS
ncbi:brain natriuretic peptide [Amia ocellicauda]|uniref:brain natriuretic peptide n=1 Tax=Amia ocellicauda TaxID=2972642 RepID=UPI003464848A